MTFCHHVSAASAGIRGKYRNSADNPFILPSTLIILQPFLLVADLAVKLHVDGRRLRADLRVDRAHFEPLWLASWLLNCASGAQDRHLEFRVCFYARLPWDDWYRSQVPPGYEGEPAPHNRNEYIPPEMFGEWYHIPYWMLALIFATLPVVSFFFFCHWRTEGRRRSHGLCLICGYDLRAHRPGQRCPECGTPIPLDKTGDGPPGKELKPPQTDPPAEPLPPG